MLKPSYMFKFSLGIGIFVLLVSMFGGAPATASAAPKPSKTPRPTRTARPTQTATLAPTNTPLPTSTFTLVPTFTFTPEPTFTFTPEPTFTFTPTATATPCRISATIFPPGGFVTPGDVEIFASDANNCGYPVEYHWDCGSPTNINCPEIMATVNVPPYNHSHFTLLVGVDDVYDIALWVCLPGDWEVNLALCSPVFRTYLAQEI